MVFIKVMCVYELFKNNKQRLKKHGENLSGLLGAVIEGTKELNTKGDSVSVVFQEQEVYGPQNHVFIEVFVLQKCDPFSSERLARELCSLAQSYFEQFGMATMKVGCSVDTCDGGRGFAVSRE